MSSTKLNLKIALGLFFVILTNLTYGQLDTEYFATQIPSDWAVKSNVSPAPSANWIWNGTNGYQPPGFTERGCAVVAPAANKKTADYYLITKQFLVPDNGEIRFFTRQGSVTNFGAKFYVKISISDPVVPGPNPSWTTIAAYDENNLNVTPGQYLEKIVSIPPGIPAGTLVYVAFVESITYDSANDIGTRGDSWFVDDVRVVGECAQVAGIQTTLTSDTAIINWTHPLATNFDIDVVPFVAGHGIGTNVNGFSYTVNGLDANKQYNVYIKANCNPGTLESAWAGPFTIKTPAIGLECAAPIIIPDVAINGAYTLTANMKDYHNLDGPKYTTQGSGCLPAGLTQNYLLGYSKIFFTYTPVKTGLITITQTITTGPTPCSNNANTGVFVYDSCDKVGVECLAGLYTDAAGSKQIPNLLVQAGHTYYIVMGNPFGASPTPVNLCFSFKVEGSDCPAPAVTEMSYNHLTNTGVSLSWGNTGNLVNQWQYVVKPAANGAPIGSDVLYTTTNNTDNSDYVGLLIQGTSYNLFVRSVCSGSPGAWSGPFPFKTQCGPVSLPFYTGFETATDTNPKPCFTSLDLNHDGDFFIYGPDPIANTYNAKLRLSQAKSLTNDMLVSPSFVLDGVTQKRIRFSYLPYPNGLIGSLDNTGGGPGSNQNVYATFKVKVSLTGVGDETHDFIYEIQPQKTVSLYDDPGYQYIFKEQRIPIPANLTGTANVAIILPNGVNQSASQFFVDDVYIEDMPNCAAPYLPKVVAGSVTTNSVQLAWTPGYQETSWEIAIQTRGTGVPTTDGKIVTNNPYTDTTVQPSTRYEYYVRAVCSGTSKSTWVGPVYFDTPCVALPLPFCDNFNEAEVTTKKWCWTLNNVDGGASKWTMGATEPSMNLSGALQADTNFNDWLITPQLISASNNPVRLTFDYRAYVSPINFTPGLGFQILVSTTDINPNSFTEVLPLFTDNNTGYINKEVIIPPVGAGNFYVAFRVPPSMTSNYSGLQIDNVCVKALAGCSNPIDLTATNVTTNAASLGWTRGYLESNWEIVIQEAGLGMPTGLGKPITTNPYSADNLSAGTNYEFYVRAVCDVNDPNNKSEWIGPYTFLTLCDPFPTPFKETFDSNSTTEKCWRTNNANADNNEWSMNMVYRAISGDQMAGINDGTNGKNDDWLISPTLTVKPNQRIRFKYMTYSQYHNEDIKVKWSDKGIDTPSFDLNKPLFENSVYTTTGAAGVAVGATSVTLTSNPGVKIGDYIDTDGIHTEVYQDDIGARVTGISADGLTITFDIPAYGNGSAGQTISFIHELLYNPTWKEKIIPLSDVNFAAGTTKNVNFAIQIPFYPSRNAYKGQYTFIDDFIVEDIPACSPPINVTKVSITDTTAKVDWDPTGTESSWQISLQPYGTPAPVGDTLPEYLKTATTHPYILTGLTPAYKYQYYIRAACGGSSKSEWVGPFEFTTMCSTLNACKYTIILDDVVNVKPPGTVDLIQNGVTVQQLQFPNANFPSNPVPPAPASYDVLFCNGVAFSVYWNTAVTSTTQYCCPTVTIVDSSGATVFSGNIGAKPQQVIYSGYSSCGTTTCPRPINLTASNLSVLSWTKGGSETQWEVAVQPVGNGTIPQSGHIISTTTYTPTEAAGDFSNPNASTYEYFVRAVCGTSNSSIWSGPYVFVRNDEASTAVMAPVNTGKDCVNAMNVSFISATASPEPSSCTGINGGDVWLDFTATSKIHNIELLNYSPGSYTYTNPWPKVVISLYEVGTDGKLVEKACSETRSLTAWYSSELVVGKVYKLRLKLNDTALDGYRKFFDVCITTPQDLSDFNNINADLEDLPEQVLNQFVNTNIFPGWNDNSNPALSAIIIWEATNSLPHFPAYSGGQYIQLNGQDSKTYDPNKIVGLYTDIDTSVITQLDYSFANATRQAAGSTVQLYAGPPSGPFELVTERPATNAGWKLETGSYIVPNTQPITRFIFRTKDNVIGHLLDLMTFKPNNEITTKLTQDISYASQSSVSVSAIGKGKWSADPNNPAATVIASPDSNATTISGFDTTGSYVFHWKTRYCDKTMTVNYQGTPEKADTTSPIAYCVGDTPSQLQATAPAGFTLMWYTKAAGGVGSTTAPTPSTDVAETTNYYVGLLGSNGYEGPRTLVAVIVNALPKVTVNSPSFIACGTATVTATPDKAGTYSYVWTVPAGATNPGNVASFTTSVAGTYSVIITNKVTTCVSESASGTVTKNTGSTVTVNSDVKAPAIKLTSALKIKDTVCNGGTVSFSAAAGSIGVVEWQMSTDNINWTTVKTESQTLPRNPLFTYTSGVLSEGTVYFRTMATNDSCSSVVSIALKITVSPAAVVGGITLNNSGTVCSYQTPKVATATAPAFEGVANSTTLTLSEYTGAVTWYKSINYVNPTNAKPSWSPIKTSVAVDPKPLPNPNYLATTTLVVNNLSKTEWYKAVVTSGACTVESAVQEITVTPIAKAGAITAPQSICYNGITEFTSAASIGSAVQWQYSLTAPAKGKDGIITGDYEWKSFEGYPTSASLSLTDAFMGGSKFYVRTVVSSGSCLPDVYSAIKTITVDKPSIAGAAIGGGLVCAGDGGVLSLSGNLGKIQWQYSTGGEFFNIPATGGVAGLFATTSPTSVGTSYVLTNIQSNVSFRALVINGTCSPGVTSNDVTYTVGAGQAVAGTVKGGNSPLCPTNSGTTLTLDGYTGSVQWQKAIYVNNTLGVFTNISKMTFSSLNTGKLTATTAFRAIVTAGSCSSEPSNVVVVSVLPKPVAKTISSTTSSGTVKTPMCVNDHSKLLTIGANSVGNIQWQKSTISATEGFENIANATGTTYTDPSPAIGPNYFKAIFSNGCGNDVSSTVFTVYYSDDDKVCGSQSNDDPFVVKVYPNPYADTFKLDVITFSDDDIQVSVYDPLGKQVESHEFKANTISKEEIGYGYTTGVYNVVVSQGSEVKTVRVVKR